MTVVVVFWDEDNINYVAIDLLTLYSTLLHSFKDKEFQFLPWMKPIIEEKIEDG